MGEFQPKLVGEFQPKYTIYHTYQKMGEEKQQQHLDRAEKFLEQLK